MKLTYIEFMLILKLLFVCISTSETKHKHKILFKHGEVILNTSAKIENLSKISLNEKINNFSNDSKQQKQKLKENNNDNIKKLVSRSLTPHFKLHHLDHLKETAHANAVKSIEMFILGIIIISISIIMTIYNEYRSIHFTQYIDILDNNEKCQEIIHAAKIDLDPETDKDKIYVIYGMNLK